MSSDDPARYRLDYDARARRQLDRVPSRDYEQIRAKIRALATNPRPPHSRRLRDGSIRIRWGNWRIFYLIDHTEQVVTITDVLRRNEATYRDL